MHPRGLSIETGKAAVHALAESMNAAVDLKAEESPESSMLRDERTAAFKLPALIAFQLAKLFTLFLLSIINKGDFMRIISHLSICAVAAMLIAPNLVSAAPSANQICQKMISEGRGGGMSQSDCLCTYRVADAVLDEDVKSLLFDSWYSGTNNMKAIERLPKQGRVRKQLKTMQRSLKVNCE